jgi:hypothetical protein
VVLTVLVVGTLAGAYYGASGATGQHGDADVIGQLLAGDSLRLALLGIGHGLYLVDLVAGRVRRARRGALERPDVTESWATMLLTVAVVSGLASRLLDASGLPGVGAACTADDGRARLHHPHCCAYVLPRRSV